MTSWARPRGSRNLPATADPALTTPARPGSPIRGALGLGGLLLGYTLVVLTVPSLRFAWDSPQARVALEVGIVAVMVSVALLLALLHRTGEGIGRDAFIAALVVQCLSNLAFGIIPAVMGEPLGLERSFYPWLAGRWIAGMLLLAAAVRARPGRVLTTVAVAVAAVAAVDLVIGALDLPLPSGSLTTGSTPDVAHFLLEGPPMVMFAVGAVVAGRWATRSGEPLERWFSLALLVGVFTHLHEAAFPAALGPVITSADLLRGASAGILGFGVVAQVLRLQHQRDRAVALLQDDLAASRQRLDDVRQAREREAAFVSVIGHELSSPIAAIGARAHVLEMLAPGPALPHISAIRGEAERLGGLVQRMDELRQLEDVDFSVDLRPVAIMPLLDEVATFARGLPGRFQVIVEAEASRVSADPVRLGQVLRNVLGNSTRYAPPGTPITIRGSASDGYTIILEDRGPGVVGDDVEQLFTPWVRGAAVDETDGMGIGLHLARRIIDAHGGTITFLDPDQPGARVAIRLDLA